MFQEADRHNLTWFYPKICKFQDDPAGVLPLLEGDCSPEGGPVLLYVHVPFCENLCSYCACFKEPLGAFTDEDLADFAGCLVAELAAVRALNGGGRIPVRYVQFGGGTPSCLPTALLERIFAGIAEHCDLSRCRGISFEGNVMSLKDPDRLRLLRDAGVSRVSFGVQTFDPALRRALNVRATLADVRRTVENLAAAGIPSFALDLIYNLPDQSFEILDADLQQAAQDLSPDLIQLYPFNQFTNTGLDRRIRAGRFRITPSQQREGQMMRHVVERLAALGYPGRPLINLFARGSGELWTGMELSLGGNRLNGGQMLGVGPGAMSYLWRTNHRNHCSVRRYVQDVGEGRPPVECGHPASAAERRHKVMTSFPAFLRIPRSAVPDDPDLRGRLATLVRAGLVTGPDPAGSADPAGTEEYVLTEEGAAWAGNVSYYFFSDDEVRRNRITYYRSIKHRKNPFNQDDMNMPASSRAPR